MHEHLMWLSNFRMYCFPDDTDDTERYRQQMIDLNQAIHEKRPEYRQRDFAVNPNANTALWKPHWPPVEI